MAEKENKIFVQDNLELKDLNDRTGEVAFYFANWEKDLGGDVIAPTAYEKTFKQNKSLFYHNRDHKDACGQPSDFQTDSFGAFCVSKLALKTVAGNDTYEQYKAGLIKGHSQEYVAVKAYPEDWGRTIKEMKLYGVTSVTNVAMNQLTPTISIKSFDTIADKMKRINDMLHTGRLSEKAGERFCQEYKRLADWMEKNKEFMDAGIVHCENCKTIIIDEAPESKCASCGRFINNKSGKSIAIPLIDKNFINQFKLK